MFVYSLLFSSMKIPKFEAQTEWVKPTEFPDLRQVDEIAIDLETKDPDLIKKGSGAVIGNGEVIGIAVATKNFKGYFPIAHKVVVTWTNKESCLGLKMFLKHHQQKYFSMQCTTCVGSGPWDLKLMVTLFVQ